MSAPRLYSVCKLSPQLSKLVGKQESIRPQVIRDVWKYIKTNNLQNPDKKSEIINDKVLTDLFGQPTCTTPEIMKLISPHIMKAGPDAKREALKPK